MAQNLPATKTLKAKGKNSTKARRVEWWLGIWLPQQIEVWFGKLFRQQTNEAKSRATLLAADYSLSVVLEARVY